MPQIKPITELRNTNEISSLCHAVKEPIFITRNGYGDLVIMSMETYEAMTQTTLTDAAITEAEEEYGRTGQSQDAGEVLRTLRDKYFG